ncbi:MAG: hypothetical protein OTJ45_00575 [Alphaproteobacteria bacterium]|nr:hypothetical protein [Alphaproteobacteria bacterium]
MSDVGTACVEEIHRLHRAISDWTTGAIPNTEESFAAFAESFGPEFIIINPNGESEAAATVVPRFRERYCERGGLGFSIRITDEDVRDISGDRALVVYQEHWLHGPEEQSVILSSALMQADLRRPGGIAWLHLHETWLRAPA